MRNVRYEALEDGQSFGIDLAKAPRRISRTLHTSLTEEVDAVEEFNRGAKRGDTILVTGDRPRFALMRTFPEDKSDPDLIKLGDLRIGIDFEGAFEWIDRYENITTVFRPSRTEYMIEAKSLRGLRISLTVSQAGDWGAVAKLSLMNAGGESLKLTVKLAYGGIARHGRTFTASYFDIDKDDVSENEVALHEGSAILSDSRIPERICACCAPPAPPEIEGRKAIFKHRIELEPGETREIFLTAARLGGDDAKGEALRLHDPEALIREASEYYEGALAGISISTPSSALDSAFLTAIVNLEYAYAGTLWLEGVHWWSSFWPDNYQISAAIALGQLERARKALHFLGSLDSGPCPALMASGKVFSSHIGVYTYGIEEGLPYYLHQLLQYVKHSGDAELVGSLWDKLKASIAYLFEKRANSGSGLLDWHLGCNGFLYQADHLAMPGDAASPSVMVAWLLDKLAAIARELGKIGDAGDWKAASAKMGEKLLSTLWNDDEGVFYNHVDYQGIQHMAHFYTDMAFPVLYSDFSEEIKRRSMDELRVKLVYEADDGRLLMRAGDFKPSIFGNDNVMPAQMCEAARALFQTGDAETGFGLLESVALAATIYTEAPGNFPERMDDDGKGEANYIFGNPIGSYIYALISGLFGIGLIDGGETLCCSPAFPSSWDRAGLQLPYCGIEYGKSAKDGRTLAVYTITSHPARRLEFSVLLDATEIHGIHCSCPAKIQDAGTEYGRKKVVFVSSESREEFELSIEYGASKIPRVRRFWEGPKGAAHPASEKHLAALNKKELRALDIGKRCDSDTIHATSAWRNEDLRIDLSAHRRGEDSVDIEGLLFKVEWTVEPARPSARMILLENSRSHPATGRTVPSGRESRARIGVAGRVEALALLYASECMSRQTGVEVGSIALNYESGAAGRTPLIVGKNIDTLFSHFAEDALPVAVPSPMQEHPGHPGTDYINLLIVPCDPRRVLDSVEFSIDLPDVQMGIIAISAIPSAREELS